MHNMHGDFSLLWTRKIEVHTHVMRTGFFWRMVPSVFNAKILSLTGEWLALLQ